MSFRGRGAPSYGHQEPESGAASSTFGMNLESFASGMPARNSRPSSGASPDLNLDAMKMTSPDLAQNSNHQQRQFPNLAVLADELEPHQPPFVAVNTFPYGPAHSSGQPHQNRNTVYQQPASLPKIAPPCAAHQVTDECLPVSYNPQAFQQQTPMYVGQPMYQPVMYDGSGAQMGPGPFYHMSGAPVHPGFFGAVRPVWMPQQPQQVATHFEQQQQQAPMYFPIPAAEDFLAHNQGNNWHVDVAIDATKVIECVDRDTQTSPQKGQLKPSKPRPLLKAREKQIGPVVVPIESGKVAAPPAVDWPVPNVMPGEVVYGWDSPEKNLAKSVSWSPGGVSSELFENRECRTQSPEKTEKSGTEFGSASRSMYDGVFDFKASNQQAEEYRLAELAKLTPIVKDVYEEHLSVTNLTDEEVLEFRESKNIAVHYPKPEELSPLFNVDADDSKDYTKLNIPKPVSTFHQAFGNYPEILSEVAKQGFDKPTPIQSQIWPCVMKGKDVVGIAQTGSGKTLGFLLPAFIHIEKQIKPRSERTSPTVLILAPTRELAQQIHKEVLKYNYKGIKSVCLYGGNPRYEQVNSLRVNPEIVIATAGRLNDLVQSNDLDLKEVSFLILDEADEMLDQGFEPQINKALIKIREDRQTILTSATWPESVRRMAKNYTKDPIMVVIGTVELRAVTSVKQNIVFVEQTEKYEWLTDFLKNKLTENEKLIVFVGSKAFADHLSSELSLMRLKCVCIHGGLPQSDRERAIEDMKSGDSRVLIASDVVARGIDIECVTYIINYDMPKNSEMYIHRIGRTGRAGRTGESFTLVTRRDWHKAQDLINILTNAGQEVPEELLAMARRFKNRPDRGGGFRGGRGGGYHQNEGHGGSYSNYGGERPQRYQGYGQEGYDNGGRRSYGDYQDRGQYSDNGSREFTNRGGGGSRGFSRNQGKF